MSDLARKLVEHPRWEWQTGMICESGAMATACYYETPRGRCEVLDLDHPATKGWLLSMLREATGDDWASTTGEDADGGRPDWYAWVHGEIGHGDRCSTEGEALARALLAAWDTVKNPIEEGNPKVF